MMTSPILGRVTRMAYVGGGEQLQQSVLRVYFRTPMDTIEHHDFPNENWHVNNPALQFLAQQGYKPSDFGDSETLDVEDDKLLLPIVSPEPGEWVLGQRVISAGDDALRRADWFGGAWPEDEQEDAENDAESVEVEVK